MQNNSKREKDEKRKIILDKCMLKFHDLQLVNEPKHGSSDGRAGGCEL